MFSDPQVVTYATVAKSLPCIGRSDDSSEYRLNDSGVIYHLALSHKFAARNRAVIRLRRDSVVTDPLVTASNIAVGMTSTLTVDFPGSGLLPVDAQSLTKALVGWATDANILKLVNGET